MCCGMLELTSWSVLEPEVSTARVSKHNSFSGISKANKGFQADGDSHRSSPKSASIDREGSGNESQRKLQAAQVRFPLGHPRQ